MKYKADALNIAQRNRTTDPQAPPSGWTYFELQTSKIEGTADSYVIKWSIYWTRDIRSHALYLKTIITVQLVY